MIRNLASHVNSATVRAVLLVILTTNAAISLEIPDLRKRTNFVNARKGAVNIGYMLSVHTVFPEDGACSVLRPHEVVCFEAFKMAVEAVNRRPDILPNISLGYVAVDDCLDDTKATEMAVYMMTEHAWPPDENRNSSSCGSSSADEDRVVGVVGLATSSLAVAVSPYFGVYHVPTLSVYATSDSLDDKSRHRFFSRLVPPDRFQVETLLQLADRMDWTYVALVFSEGAYGENAAAQALLLAVSEVVSPSSVGLKMPSPYVKAVEKYCSKDLALFLVPLGYNIALMGVCAVIGCVTRKLPENFNESAYIFASVSMTLFAWVIFVPAYLVQSSQALQPAVMGFCLVINSSIALACQFFRVAVFFVAPKEFACGPKSIVVPISAATTRAQQSS